jgi:hypothetical protein
MYQTDVLELLGIFAKPGEPLLDPRAQEALDLVEKRQDEQGRWTLQQTFNGRFHADIETKGQPGRWVTLRALKVLKAAGRLQARPAT